MRPESVPGSIVTSRIRSSRPSMPSISGPRSIAASSFTVTPRESGTFRSSVIEFLPSQGCRPLKCAGRARPIRALTTSACALQGRGGRPLRAAR